MQVKVNVDHYKNIAQRNHVCYVCNRGLNAAELQDFLKHQVAACCCREDDASMADCVIVRLLIGSEVKQALMHPAAKADEDESEASL